jgi:hypothetical protein
VTDDCGEEGMVFQAWMGGAEAVTGPDVFVEDGGRDQEFESVFSPGVKDRPWWAAEKDSRNQDVGVEKGLYFFPRTWRMASSTSPGVSPAASADS